MNTNDERALADRAEAAHENSAYASGLITSVRELADEVDRLRVECDAWRARAEDAEEWRKVYGPDVTYWQRAYATACSDEARIVIGRKVVDLAREYYEAERPRMERLVAEERAAALDVEGR